MGDSPRWSAILKHLSATLQRISADICDAELQNTPPALICIESFDKLHELIRWSTDEMSVMERERDEAIAEGLRAICDDKGEIGAD